MLKIKSIIPPLYELYVVPSYFNIKNPRKCKGSFNSSQSWQSILYTLIFFFIFVLEMQHGLLIIYLQVSYWFLRIQLSILFARIPSPPLFPNETAGYQARRYVLQWPKKSPKRVLKNLSLKLFSQNNPHEHHKHWKNLHENQKDQENTNLISPDEQWGELRREGLGFRGNTISRQR